MWLWPLALAVVIGVALSQQPAVNSVTANVLGSVPAAAALSLGLSSLILIVIAAVMGAPTRPADFLNLPWWSVLGGVFGALFVAGSTFLVPITGAAVFFVCLVAGQMLGALVVDAVGGFGLQERAVSIRKLAGIALVFIGIVLIRLE